MPLEEDWRYETVSGKKVIMRWSLEYSDMTMYYWFELAKILGIRDKSREERKEILKDHKVLSWLTSDLSLPWGFWHDKTGKCLWLNTGWVVWWEKLKKLLAWFDIKVDE